MGDDDAGINVCAVPLVGVSVMLAMVTLKESIEKLVGGVSATSVKLTVAVPPPPPPPVLGTPLQEVREKAASKSRACKMFLRIMEPPRTPVQAKAGSWTHFHFSHLPELRPRKYPLIAQILNAS